ncbi:MAG TPA: sugar ABC transporter substrate-binding protein [Lachnospiraceae bacterium]|nr:sugar ABC transporter substrate-binding protein [Lachnospiraceae bacterium]
MKKKIISTALSITMAASLVGCAVSPDAEENAATGEGELQVGIVLPTRDEPRWIQDEASFTSILGDAGFTSEVLFSQGSSATELTNVESLIEKGIDVLVICAQDATAAAQAVEVAHAAGVQVICYDRLITGTDAVDYYVTFDSVAVGKAQGQYLIDNKPEGSGIPLYLYAGAATDNNAFLFFEGAWEVLQPYVADGTFVIANSDEANKLADKAELTKDEQAKIIGQVTTDWDFNVAKSKAEAHLTANDASLKGDVVILAPNDGTARSIADTFAADADVKSYVITGQDAEVASVNYIANGKQSMTVFKNTSTLAADSCAMAAAILNNTTPETVTTYNNGKKDVPAKQTDITVVTQDNYKEVLIDSGYYTEDEIK